MSGYSTHSIPQAGARPQRTETSTPWGQASIIPRECDGGVEVLNVESNHKHSGHVWPLNPWHLHKPAQDHREKRHPHHEGKPVYYPENVVEVLGDRHMATEVQKDTVQLFGTRAGKQHLNMRDSRGVGGSGGVGGSRGVGGEKAAEVLEVDQFYIAGDADTESKQFKTGGHIKSKRDKTWAQLVLTKQHKSKESADDIGPVIYFTTPLTSWNIVFNIYILE
ncbi:hypothetical protein B0H14DRAFT_2595952 [Mycena olivaceomarginata]|nr:hypothetical protein B0H14DRAFT_2595952 [Mycena olivaceomarginata]